MIIEKWTYTFTDLEQVQKYSWVINYKWFFDQMDLMATRMHQ